MNSFNFSSRRPGAGAEGVLSIATCMLDEPVGKCSSIITERNARVTAPPEATQV